MPTIQRLGELQKTVLEVLRDNPDGIPAREAIAEAAKRVELNDEELDHYASSPGVRKFDKIVRFATIRSVKAGWMLKEKGGWSITHEGLEALTAHPDSLDLYREAQKGYAAWKAQQEPEESDETEEVDPGALTSSVTLEEAEEQAWNEILAFLEGIDPYKFQDLVGHLLEAMGYHVTWIAPPGPDKGVDLIAHRDPLGTSSPRIKVQVKRRQGKINPEGLRSFMATLGTSDVGIFISTGGFTKDAAMEARTQESRLVTLLDARDFTDFWVEHLDQIPESGRRLFPLTPVHFLSP